MPKRKRKGAGGANTTGTTAAADVDPSNAEQSIHTMLEPASIDDLSTELDDLLLDQVSEPNGSAHAATGIIRTYQFILFLLVAVFFFYHEDM